MIALQESTLRATSAFGSVRSKKRAESEPTACVDCGILSASAKKSVAVRLMINADSSLVERSTSACPSRDERLPHRFVQS